MPEQHGSKDEKIYRFISDPRHKETLSGRVRAACLTCRRKKVKCDGEIPCNTCKDRGVHCEGFTERRRAKTKPDARRTSDVSTDIGQYSPAASAADTPKPESSQQGPPHDNSRLRGASSSAPRRPTLQKSDTMNSDSGYSSGRQSAQHGIMPKNIPHLETTQPTVPTYEYSSEIRTTDVGSPDWSFFTPPSACTQNSPDLVECGNTGLAGLSIESANWTDPGIRNASWLDNNASGPQSAAHLISAARVLEEQAQSLRRLASRQISETRRQTVTFPMALDDCPTAIDVSLHPAGASDDMALLFADRTPNHGLPFTSPDFAHRVDKGSRHTTAIDELQAAAIPGQAPPLVCAQIIEPGNTVWHYTLDADTRSSPKSTFDNFRELRPLNQNTFAQTQTFEGDQVAIMGPRDCLFPWAEQ